MLINTTLYGGVIRGHRTHKWTLWSTACGLRGTCSASCSSFVRAITSNSKTFCACRYWFAHAYHSAPSSLVPLRVMPSLVSFHSCVAFGFCMRSTEAMTRSIWWSIQSITFSSSTYVPTYHLHCFLLDVLIFVITLIFGDDFRSLWALANRMSV